MLFSLAAVLLPGQTVAQSTSLYTLVFQDTFQGSSLDTSVWGYRTDGKAYSQQMAANVQAGGGAVTINLKEQSSGGYSYTGGGIVSKTGYHYGYYEGRIKMNAGTGWHSSLWLFAGDGDTTYDASEVPHNHTEIDVFERNSVANNTMDDGWVQWNGNTPIYHGSGTKTVAYDFTQWNTFGTYWLEDYILTYVNGNLFNNQTYTPQTWTHDYLNIWFSCIAYGNEPDNSYLPSTVQASEISYYQKDFYLTAGSLCFLNAPTSAGTACPSNAGYSESGSGWATSSLSGYTYQLLTRYSCETAGASASWALPSNPPAGTYQIWAWVIPTKSDTAASYAIKKNGGTVSTIVVNQAATANATWVQLSSGVSIASSDSWSVSVTGSGTANQCVRADTVKFVRVL